MEARCPRCNIVYNSAFCPNCGSSALPPPQDTVKNHLNIASFLKGVGTTVVVIAVLFLLGMTWHNVRSRDITIDRIISVFSENGIDVDEENKPFYFMVDASDGITFVHEDKVVIYIYNSEKDLKKAIKDYDITENWTSNGRFLLEAYNKDVVDIFNNVQ